MKLRRSLWPGIKDLFTRPMPIHERVFGFAGLLWMICFAVGAVLFTGLSIRVLFSQTPLWSLYYAIPAAIAWFMLLGTLFE